MALTQCPECSKEVSDKAPSCIHCGAPLREGDVKRADGTNVTTQQTGKDVKIQLLWASALIVLGAVGCIKTADSVNNSGFIASSLIALTGIVWWIVARISGWWRHG